MAENTDAWKSRASCEASTTRRQVVQMQEHPILPRGMDPLVDSMEPLVRGRPELQAHIAGQTLQRAVRCDAAPRRQGAGQCLDLPGGQRARRIDPHGVPPSLERVERHTPNEPPLEPLDLRGRLLGHQKRAVHTLEIRDLPA